MLFLKSALSCFLGVLTYAIPTATFFWLFLKRNAIFAPRVILNRFYMGVFFKTALTVLCFSIIFQWSSLSPVWFFTGFVVMQFSPLLSALSNAREKERVAEVKA